MLASIVSQLAQDLAANVCSIYSWSKPRGTLLLEATAGLNADLVGKLTLLPTEGLTGLVIEKASAISVKYPAHHPRYKFVPRSSEERLNSYLGVPITHRTAGIIGVVTIQTESPRIFLISEIEFIVHAADRIAPVLYVALTQAA